MSRIDFQIAEVKFAVIPSNRITREAYVLFAKHEDIEKALTLDQGKINDGSVEIYRSSISQMQFYTTIPTKKQKAVNIPTASEIGGEKVQLVKEVDSTVNGVMSELCSYINFVN